MKQQFYAVRHTDAMVAHKSSSGGAFSAIAESWFSRYGENAVVYGCILDEQLNAKHIRAVMLQQTYAMRGSKYINSAMPGVMRQVLRDLEDNRKVVFTGTPCQIAGLISFLKVQRCDFGDNLLTVEVICHGVGSTRYFKDYIAELEKRYRCRATACSFRGKKRLGKRQQMVVGFENGKEYVSVSSKCDDFLSAYSRNYIIRPSCFRCPFTTMERQADITIGDYWAEVKKSIHPCTLLMVNTSLGKAWIRNSEMLLLCERITQTQADQPQLHRPTEKPADYDNFWTVYRESGYKQALIYLGNADFLGNVRKVLAIIAYHLRVKELVLLISCCLHNNRGKK